jgi:putative hemin transport protein
MTDTTLLDRLADLRRENPKLRARDAAEALGVAEAELVAAGGVGQVRRLGGDWGDLLKALPAIGRVMCLTRNAHCVHERHGRFDDVSVNGLMGLVLGPDIDLRIFFSHWKSGFAVSDVGPHGPRLSLQIFDGHGVAVHKIYSTPETDMAAFEALVARFHDVGPFGTLELTPVPAPAVAKPDDQIDTEGFVAAWAGMKDTHEFFGLLRKFGVQRLQAMRLAGPRFATEVGADAVEKAFAAAAAQGLPIMVFVGSRGVIQIHTGPVVNLKTMGPWFNVLDPDFNLHLRADRVASAWVTRKPTEDGVVTALELFDAEGETIALIFGARKPGKPELAAWRDLAESLVQTDRAA